MNPFDTIAAAPPAPQNSAPVFASVPASSAPAAAPSDFEGFDDLADLAAASEEIDPNATAGATLHPIPDGKVRVDLKIAQAVDYKDGQRFKMTNKDGMPQYHKRIQPKDGGSPFVVIEVLATIYTPAGQVALKDQSFELSTKVQNGSSTIHDLAKNIAVVKNVTLPNFGDTRAVVAFVVTNLVGAMQETGYLQTTLSVRPRFIPKRPATAKEIEARTSEKSRDYLSKNGVEDWKNSIYGSGKISTAAEGAGDSSIRPRKALINGVVRDGYTTATISPWTKA